MTRAPLSVLIAGLVSAAMGVLLLAVSGREPVLVWYGVPVLVLGLVLVGIWVYDSRKPPPPPATPESIAAGLPGKWYPVAILVIFAALVAWFAYWSKAR